MSKRHAFRPSLAGNALEGRLVLSHATAAAALAPGRARGFDVLEGVEDRPGGGARLEVRDHYVVEFRRAFADFTDAYVQAAVDTLFAAGATPTAIVANRGAFDAQVAALVDDLTARVTAMLGRSPLARASLIPAVEEALAGFGENSLLSRLDALTTPSDLNGTTAQQFGQESGALINASFQRLIGRLNFFTASPRLDFLNGGFTTAIPGLGGVGAGGGIINPGTGGGGVVDGGGDVTGPVGGGGIGPGFLAGFPQDFELEPGFNFSRSINGVPIPSPLFGGVLQPRFAGDTALFENTGAFLGGFGSGLGLTGFGTSPVGAPARSGLGLGGRVGTGFNFGGFRGLGVV